MNVKLVRKMVDKELKFMLTVISIGSVFGVGTFIIFSTILSPLASVFLASGSSSLLGVILTLYEIKGGNQNNGIVKRRSRGV